MNAYHDIRSVRTWLNQMYPDVDILIQRNASHQKKSYFFIQDSREKFEDTGRGFYTTMRTVNIHLVTEGITPSNPGSTEPYWRTLRVLNFLRDRLLRERVIPQFIYNSQWFPPVAWTKPGGILPAGTYELATTSVDVYDKESLLSESTAVTIGATEKLFLSLTNWPYGRPLNKQIVVYLKINPTTWQAIKVIPTTITDRGSFVNEITSLTPLAGPRVPPTSSKQWMGYLKIDQATANMVESIQIDDAFHGFLTIVFRSRAPQMIRSAAPINTVGNTIAVG